MTFEYQVRIRGRLSRSLTGEFEDLGLEADVAPVETTLHGPVVDQAALYGLIRRLEALGLELVELRRIRPDPDTPGAGADPGVTVEADEPDGNPGTGAVEVPTGLAGPANHRPSPDRG